MFTTLRSDANSGLQVDSEQSAHHVFRRPACKNCHSRKLRCTREKNGCYRCISSRISCEYEVSRPQRKRARASISQISTRDTAFKAAFTPCGASGVESLPDSTSLLDSQNGTLGRGIVDLATNSPSFTVDGNLFDFLNVNFEDPINDSTFPYSRPSNFDASQSDTASEGHDALEVDRGRNSCKCLASAVSLLESISIQYVQANLHSVPQIIRHNKNALVHCRALYTCKICSKKSEFVMLLILLCQKIISSYQRTVVILTEQFNRLHRPNQDNVIQVPNVEATMVTAQEVDHSLVREYEVEVEEEPCVFGGLVQMQIKKVVSFLAALKVMLREHTWSSHIAMLDVVGNDVKELVRMCRCPEGF